MTAEQQKKFKYWQWRTIIGTMVGYIFFYLIRKNFSFAMPGLTAEYGISKATLGGILSAAGFLYGLSKLINGMLADRINGRWHMVTGLAVCTVTAVLFGFGAKIAAAIAGVAEGEAFIGTFVLVLSVLWIINNIFQGCGFPPCSRLIPRWVPSSELSTKMSLWNTSHSIGAGLAGVLCGVLIMGSMGTDMSG
ncbi:MAG: MFS transporter, partial [Alistipes sp.]|nr:MFS transporter [Alistipes sp.]